MTPMSLKDYQDYRSYLRDVLHERRRKNGSYSLRAFARALKLSPGMLSSVLNGHKRLSGERAKVVAECLDMTDIERVMFYDFVQAADARSATDRAAFAKRITYVRSAMQSLDAGQSANSSKDHQALLTQDTIEFMSHWYYFGFLDYLDVDDFKYDIYHISIKLDVPVHDLRQAIERLERLGLIRFENGLPVKTHTSIGTMRDVPSRAVRTCAKELIDKAKAAVDMQEVAERDVTATTMAIDTSRLPEAKLMIERFLRDISQFLETGTRKDGLYCFSTQLFSLKTKELV